MPLQSAAIPYRYGGDGEVQIMLITSRKKGRWGIPKGHVRLGMAAHSSAAKEAFEEAGVLGRTEASPIAFYLRALKQSELPVQVRIEVYPMAVTIEAPVWPEMHQRKRRWASIPEAMGLVSHEGTRQALSAFGEAYGALRKI